MLRGLSVWCLLGAPLVAAGCTGTIGADASGNGGPSQIGPDGKPKPPVGPEGKPGAGALSDKDTVPGAAPVRRLTRLEYDNTIRDLLGLGSVTADFTADTESNTSGFARGGAIAVGDDARVMLAAGASVADQIGGKLGSLLPCPVTAPAAEQDGCVTKFITQFGKRAYRRPLTAHETQLMQDLYKAQRAPDVGATFEQAMATLVGAIIQAPQFLYHWELGSNAPTKDGNLIKYNSYEIASKLSYLLWKTMPDDKLFEAADGDALATPEQIALQARRMLDDDKAKMGLADFHLQWSEIGDLVKIPKDDSIKDYNPDVAQAMINETRDFVTSTLLGKGPGTLQALLTSNQTVADARLAKIYGASASGTTPQPLTLDAKQRAGIFTLLAFLTAKADTGDSHPVKRGDTILRRTLCMEFKLPDNVPPVADSTPGGATTRERFSMHSMMPCATCHVIIDPIGFAFEEFDAIGAYRTMDQGKKIDSTGTATTPGGATLKFNDAVDLMNQMAALPEVSDCLTTQWLRYMLGRREVAGETPSQKVILDEFKKANYDLKALLVALTRTRTFTHRSVSPGEVTQ
ncbi:MAG TPA: DUF1592 domain-containing protein [Polyangia bacterium]|nr:DUF1592 domain-containing protein [Polyangia bacterium]